MITFRDYLLADQIQWSITADGASLVQDLFDQTPVRKHDGCGRADLDAEDPAVDFGPFCESGASISVSVQKLKGCPVLTGGRVSLLGVGVCCQLLGELVDLEPSGSK